MENKAQENQNKPATEHQLPKEESHQEIKEQHKEKNEEQKPMNNSQQKPSQNPVKEIPKEEERAPPAEGEDVVWVEFCQNCKSHGWCTRHDEKKYLWFFQKLREKIEGETGIRVEMAKTKPALGSFEVKFNETLIFSKIATLQWPYFEEIMEKLKEAKENPPKTEEQANNENTSPSKEVSNPAKSQSNTKKPANKQNSQPTHNQSQGQKKATAPSNNVPKYDLIQTPQKKEDSSQKIENHEENRSKERQEQPVNHSQV